MRSRRTNVGVPRRCLEGRLRQGESARLVLAPVSHDTFAVGTLLVSRREELDREVNNADDSDQTEDNWECFHFASLALYGGPEQGFASNLSAARSYQRRSHRDEFLFAPFMGFYVGSV